MKNYSKLLMVALVAIALIGVASAAGNAQTLKLVQKNSATWGTVDGAFGNLMIKEDSFVFTGHGMPDDAYTLISYREPWGTSVEILGTGEAKSGQVQIKSEKDVAPTLVCNNYNGFTTGDYRKGTGSKIWLVPSADLDGTIFKAWNPDAYLFETELVNVDCTA